MCGYNREICFAKGADVGWLKDINFIMRMEKKKIALRYYKAMG